MAERKENSSLLDSRLVKGGSVAAVIGGIFGIGLAVELGFLAVGGGAATHYATKRGKNHK
jgi:hypothetical protein